MLQLNKVYRWPLALLSCLLCVLIFTSSASAQTARPLSEVLVNLQGSSWEDVQDRAALDAANDGPLYPNAPTETPAYENFEGDWTPQANAALAVFSDDGVTLLIDGVPVHSRKDQGQALPILGESLHRVSYKFEAGRTYHLRLEYSNTIYSGTSDIDGASIFAFTDDPNQGVKATFVAGLTGGVVRACAGAVGNDNVHSATVQVLAKRDGQNLPNVALVFSFENNVGNPKAAKFINDQGQQVDTLTRTTDSEAKTSVTVLSSDTISQPKIVVKYEDKEMGSVACNFVAAMSLRRFGIKDYVEKVDNGWLFNQGAALSGAGATTPVKVYLKFRKNPDDSTHPIDDKYFLVNNNPQPTLDADGDGTISPEEREQGSVRLPLDDDGNWAYVNGHSLRIKVAEIKRADEVFVSPEAFGDYITLLNSQGQPVNEVVAVTANDGAASAQLKSANLISLVEEVVLEAEDQDQVN